MNMPLKIVEMGDVAVVVLPPELLDRLNLSVGDTVYAAEAVDSVRLTPTRPDLAETMAAAERIMREDRDILHVLAQ